MAKGNPHPDTKNIRPWRRGETGNPKGYSKSRRAADAYWNEISKVLGRKTAMKLKMADKAVQEAYAQIAMNVTKEQAQILLKLENIPMGQKNFIVGVATDTKNGSINTMKELFRLLYGTKNDTDITSGGKTFADLLMQTGIANNNDDNNDKNDE